MKDAFHKLQPVFRKSDLGAQNLCLERSKSLQNPSFWTGNDTKFESAVSWRRTHVILPFQRKILKTPRIMLPCSQQKLERTALRRRKMSGFKCFSWKGFFSLGLMCNCKVFGTSVSNRNNGKILGFSHSRSVLGKAILRAPVIFYFSMELLRRGFP